MEEDWLIAPPAAGECVLHLNSKYMCLLLLKSVSWAVCRAEAGALPAEEQSEWAAHDGDWRPGRHQAAEGAGDGGDAGLRADLVLPERTAALQGDV